MYISRPSEPRTVLLWGDRWWFAGTGHSKQFADLTQAVDLLVAHFASEPKPVRIRLLFQPDALQTVAVTCPQGDRATLASALSAEFPELSKPEHAWSHEPVLPNLSDFATLLHVEEQPGLLGLATQLARRGLAVDSAWPLATFLHALPQDWSNSGAVTVVAVQKESAISYCHPADGVRDVLHWHGGSTLAEVGGWLDRLLERDAEEPILLVGADEAAVAALGVFVGVKEHPGVELLSLGEALARPVEFPRYHPAQLLPRPPMVTAQRAMIAATVALLLAAGWSGTAYVRAHLATRVAAKQQQEQLAALRREVTQLRENAAEIAGLRRSLEGGAAGPPCGDLLEKIATTLPAQVTLGSLRITGRTVALDGWVAPGAGRSVVDDWRSRLAPADAPWTMEAKNGPAGSFSVVGRFRL
jgi:hypothetical protein